MSFKIGDTVQLKEPTLGRKFKGKIKLIKDGKITVTLSNGLYVSFNEEDWERVEEGE